MLNVTKPKINLDIDKAISAASKFAENKNPAIYNVTVIGLLAVLIVSMLVMQSLAPYLLAATLLAAGFSVFWLREWARYTTKQELGKLYASLSGRLDESIRVGSVQSAYQEMLDFIKNSSKPLRIYIHDYVGLQRSEEWKYIQEILAIFCRNIQHGIGPDSAKIYIYYTEAGRSNIAEFSKIETKFLGFLAKKYKAQYDSEDHGGETIDQEEALRRITPHVRALRMNATDAASSVVLADDHQGKLLYRLGDDQAMVISFGGFLTNIIGKGFDKFLQQEYLTDVEDLAGNVQYIRDNYVPKENLYQGDVVKYFAQASCSRYLVLSINGHCVFGHSGLAGQDPHATILDILKDRVGSGQTIELQSYVVDPALPELRAWAAFDVKYPPVEYEKRLSASRRSLGNEFDEPKLCQHLPVCRLIFIGKAKEKNPEKVYDTLLVSFYDEFKYDKNLAESEKGMQVYVLDAMKDRELFTKFHYYLKDIVL